jgi:malonyl-CoA/methylmalonyl-CoA synthetase
MNSNLYCLLAAHFPADRSACAIETLLGLYYSFGDLENASAKIANLLIARGLKPGDRVAVQVDKSPEAVMLYLAVLRAGLVYVPLNTAYRQDELSYFFANAAPAAVVCSPASLAWVEAIAQAAGVRCVFSLGDQRDGTLLEQAARCSDKQVPANRAGGDLAAILYTSGTTGRSKGAMLSHDNLASNAQCLKTYWGWRARDVLLHVLPIFHVHGLFVALNGALINGSKMLWLNKFDPEAVIRWLPRTTVFMGVPTLYVRLLDSPQFTSKAARNMRLFVSGSAPLLKETFEQFEQRIGKRILERYGMSETLMLTSNPYEGERLAGTVGLALPGLQLRIASQGADGIGGIEVKGLSVFSGYWQMPEKNLEEFTADGYFKTGDVGVISERGYVSIVGRSKDLIITGGFNVYPKEIEALLDELPGVAESAVIGVPDRDFGEAVTAVIVPRAGATINEPDLIALLKTRIANFKVPKRIHVLKQLPRNAMGKVQKNLLRTQFGS